MIGQSVAPSAQTDTHSARLRRLRSKHGRGGGVTVNAEACLAAFITWVVGETVARELATEAAKTSVRTEFTSVWRVIVTINKWFRELIDSQDARE